MGHPKPRISRVLFEEVMKKGHTKGNTLVSVRFLTTNKEKGGANQKEEKPFAAVVSKKSYKKAVDRNKLKRRGRAIFDSVSKNCPPGNYILFFKKGTLELPFSVIKNEVKTLFEKLK